MEQSEASGARCPDELTGTVPALVWEALRLAPVFFAVAAAVAAAGVHLLHQAADESDHRGVSSVEGLPDITRSLCLKQSERRPWRIPVSTSHEKTFQHHRRKNRP